MVSEPAKAARRRGSQPRPAPMQDWLPMAMSRRRPPSRGPSAAARASPKGRLVAPTKEAGNRTPARGCCRGQPCRPQGLLPLGRAAAGGQRQPPPAYGAVAAAVVVAV
ncbi:hypothetical protein BHE74_00054247 [Ensete ventricosum]|nr:hypothetical protein BHE74_00054247 [Ensete ventricosum]